MDDPQARQGLRRGPWEAPGVPLEQGDRDREPSSLRWMAPYRLSKLDWIGLLDLRKFRGNTIPELCWYARR